MKINWWMVGIALAFVLGMAIGTGLGMQKGQYMLFEGLDGIFDGAEINIDLNETQLVEGMKEVFVPIFNETLQEKNLELWVLEDNLVSNPQNYNVTIIKSNDYFGKCYLMEEELEGINFAVVDEQRNFIDECVIGGIEE